MPYNIGIDARRLGDPGIGHYVRNLVESLAEIDQDNVYSLFVGGFYAGEFDELPDNFLRVTERSPLYSLRERVALSWRQVRQHLDLYHATHYTLPLWVPRRTVTTVHNILDLLYPDFMPGRLAMVVGPAQIRNTLARSDRVIAESQSTKADLVAHFDVSPHIVRRVYPGVNPCFTPDPQPHDEAVRASHGLEGPYAVFRGDPGRHKNEENLIRAFAAATEKAATNVALVCIGEREISPQRWAYLATKLGIENRIYWLDPMAESDLAAVLRAAQLFLYPTLYEGFPKPVVESMACGVPVVTANSATVREVAEGCAKLVDTSSVSSLAGAIGWCLNDEQLRTNLAADGLARVGEFRWRRVAEQMRQIYEEVLATPNGKAPKGPDAHDAEVLD